MRDIVASRARPVREVKGFRKVSLQPGEEATVRFEIPREKLGFWNERAYVTEAGAFTVFIGGNSRDTLETTVVLP